MDKTIGTCSECGGAVVLPEFYHSVVPPKPTCANCGAVAAEHGPVIQMAKRPHPSNMTYFYPAVVTPVNLPHPHVNPCPTWMYTATTTCRS